MLNTYWQQLIKEEQSKEYYLKLQKFLDQEYKNKKIYPSKDKIFQAFDLCEYDNLKVVILGQDPYHKPNQAQGLAFSTPACIKNPPSMVNIIKEVISDIGDCQVKNGDLTAWAKQGILLINTILTVQNNNAKSHKGKGWEILINNIIKHISQNKQYIVFILWGAGAIGKIKIIDKNKHHIITSPHPSPLSSYRGFFGSKPFSQTNNFLKSKNKKIINW
jgi:uracil-DNA glycosylase